MVAYPNLLSCIPLRLRDRIRTRPVTKAEPKTAEHDGPGVMGVVVVAIYLYGILPFVAGVGYYWFRHYGFTLTFHF